MIRSGQDVLTVLLGGALIKNVNMSKTAGLDQGLVIKRIEK